MILNRVYRARQDIPKGAEPLYVRRGALFILRDANNDFVADNPWDADHWNLTAQGAFIQAHGLEMAEVFAKAADTSVGALRPKLRRDLQVLVQRRNITVGGAGGGDDALATGLATKV